jgi:hypothetical protein
MTGDVYENRPLALEENAGIVAHAHLLLHEEEAIPNSPQRPNGHTPNGHTPNAHVTRTGTFIQPTDESPST